MVEGRRTQEDRSASTRRALIDAGARLFSLDGFSGVTLDQIVAEAGVTRGALYHHYDDKTALFRAVFEHLAGQVRDELARMLARKRSSRTRLRGLLDAYLDICVDPIVRRVGLVDGPAVLGFEQWRELERKYFLGLLIDQLEAADAEQRLPSPPSVLAPIFFAVAMESSLLIAESPDPVATRRQARRALTRMLDASIAPAT